MLRYKRIKSQIKVILPLLLVIWSQGGLASSHDNELKKDRYSYFSDSKKHKANGKYADEEDHSDCSDPKNNKEHSKHDHKEHHSDCSDSKKHKEHSKHDYKEHYSDCSDYKKHGSDGHKSHHQDHKKHCEDQNESPEIISNAIQTGRKGEQYLYQVVATDADSTELSYSLKQAPNGMTITPETGIISWVANNDYYNQSIEPLKFCEQSTDDKTQKITFSDFSDLSALTLNGDTANLNPVNTNVLRLTDDLRQSGSAFITEPLLLSESSAFKASFSSAFSFQISDPQGLSDSDGQGGDGFVFVIQTQDDEIESVTGGMGYQGIKQSIGIEFDTWANKGQDGYKGKGHLHHHGKGHSKDNNGNHIGLNINGSVISTKQVNLPNRLNDGNIWFVWIDYSGVSELLEVRLAFENIRPAQATLSYSLDLSSIIQTDNAYVGFTSETNASSNIHDILNWQFINTYSPIGDVPDLVAHNLQLHEINGQYQFQAQLTNRSKPLLDTELQSGFFSADPTQNGLLLDEMVINNLATGETTQVNWPVSDISLLTDDIYLWADNREKVFECNEQNNITRSAFVWVKVADDKGAEDQQLFAISLKDENNPPRITSQPVNNAALGLAYTYKVAAIDADLGDILSYRLLDAPDTMEINENSGEISWTTFIAGDFSVTVEVIDLVGSTDRQTYPIVVHLLNNLPPEIISQPVVQATEELTYLYHAIAEDLNPNDQLTYSLELGPEGMGIDPKAGTISWTPTDDYINGITQVNNQCYLKSEGNTIRSVGDAEVLVVIDVSGSMGGETRWVGGMAVALEEKLKAAGVGSNDTNKYGLVNYSSYGPRNTLVKGGKFGSAQEFDAASASLGLYGGTEDGWQAIHFTLNDYPKAEKAARNIILVTDEDRDNRDSNITYASILQELDGQAALLNSVVNARFKCVDGTSALGMNSEHVGYVADGQGGYTLCENASAYSGSGNTIAHYVQMAMENGGAAWDLNYLRSGGHYAESFSKALIDIKVKEIIEQLPPAIAPDLMVSKLGLVKSDDGYHVQLKLLNRGLADVKTESNITVYSGDPAIDGIEIVRFTVPEMLIGQQELLDALVNESLLNQDLYAQIEATDEASECETANNITHSALVKLKVTDTGALYDTQLYIVSADDINVEPQITSQANTLARVNESYQYQVTANDLDIGDGLTFSLIEDKAQGYQIPEGLVIDDFTGLISWTATIEQQAESYVIAAKVTDLRGGEDIQLFELEVSAEAVRLFSPGEQSNYSGDPVELQLIVNHAPTAQLSYQATGLPDGLSINSDGFISGVSTIEGEYQVNLTVTDTTHYSNSQVDFVWHITAEQNIAPEITSVPNQLVLLNSLWSYQVIAKDQNQDTLTFALLKGPQGMIHQDNGLIEWTPSINQMGQHAVEITVSDGAFTQIQHFVVKVPQGNLDNYPPVVNSQPSLSVETEQQYRYQLQASDPDGDALTITLDKAPAGMLIDSQNIITWDPTKAQLGSHPVEITINDGSYTVKQSFTVTVLLPAEDNNNPLVTSQPAGLAIVDKAYRYQVVVSDADGDNLHISLDQGPVGMVIDEQHLVSWTPTSADIGEHSVVIQITDGKVLLNQSYTLKVAEANSVNHAPTFTSLPSSEQSTLAVGRELSFAINASDPDGDQLTFSIEVTGDNPIGLDIDAQTGLLTAFPFADDQITSYPYKVTVDDGNGGASFFNYQLTVLATGSNNHAPQFISQPITIVQVGDIYQYQLQASDSDGDAISYSLRPSPLHIDNNGLLNWQSLSNDIGSHEIEVSATDIYGATVLQTFTIYVLGAGDNAPVITSTAITELRLEQGEYHYQVQASDVDGQAVTFQLLQSPQGMSLDSISGGISWLADETQLGSHTVEVRAADIDGHSSEQRFELLVSNSGPWNRRMCR
ncbi:MAG: hypothetical protein ACJAZP_002853 [Psychromonas sp.]|jgi:hypothetical protein|uniref:putative Ig domain-containing protein n=1 Tax=Psychromonas sp. TaxID=1884585 RepID=UPI0039E28005